MTSWALQFPAEGHNVASFAPVACRLLFSPVIFTQLTCISDIPPLRNNTKSMNTKISNEEGGFYWGQWSSG
jgi:hypothetical protein